MFFLRDWTRDDDADADAVEFKILERIRAAGKKIETKQYLLLYLTRNFRTRDCGFTPCFFCCYCFFWSWIGIIFARTLPKMREFI